MADFVVTQGNALDVLAGMADESVHCCVTSPPFWGLRDYQVAPSIWSCDRSCDHEFSTEIIATEVGRGNWSQAVNGRGEVQGETEEFREPIRAESRRGYCAKCGAWKGALGLEPTPELFVEHIVQIFREVRRVLRADASLWINLGDSYANDTKRGGSTGGKHAAGMHGHPVGRGKRQTGLKPKDLVGIPWMVAFALRADGWYLRSDIIWAKPAPMPESVTDRPTRSHEYIFLLTKSPRYYYDHEAIKEPSVADHGSGNGYKRDSGLTYAGANGARGSDKPWQPASWNGSRFDKGKTADAVEQTGNTVGARGSKNSAMDPQHSGRRMVENVARARAEGGDHDTPFGDTRNKRDVWIVNSDPFPGAHFATYPPALIEPCIKAGCPTGGVVLDPFSGAGTTGIVACRLGRNYQGIELNPDYVAMSYHRWEQDAPLKNVSPMPSEKGVAGPLFDQEATA